MRMDRVFAMALLAAGLLAGCKKTDDSTANYTKAINTYYASRPACLWAEPQKLPVQADTGNEPQTKGYDALVDQGLLTRQTAEKKRFLIGSKEVSNYDLSDKGRAAWTADQTQPGYGNFCYGTRTVTAIDSATANNGEVGATSVVTYHTAIASPPAWASAPETEAAYPGVGGELAGPTAGTATLSDTSGGWVVTSGPKGTAKTGGAVAQ